jgi:hypothetical protein
MPSVLSTRNYDQGYDSDGELGPFFDTVANEKDFEDEIFNEEPIELVLQEQADATTHVSPTVSAEAPTLTEEEVRHMTVNQLKDELTKRKLSKSGKKDVRIERLLASLNSPVALINSENIATTSGCSPTAQWIILHHSETPVQEPNQNPNLVGPTVPENEVEPTKYNINDTFDRPPFCAMSKVIQLNRKGQPMKDRHSNIQYVSEIREEGRANFEWLQKNKLTTLSHPSDWMEALLPMQKKRMNLQPLQ